MMETPWRQHPSGKGVRRRLLRYTAWSGKASLKGCLSKDLRTWGSKPCGHLEENSSWKNGEYKGCALGGVSKAVGLRKRGGSGGGAVRSGEHCRTLWASFHLSEMEKAPEGWVLMTAVLRIHCTGSKQEVIAVTEMSDEQVCQRAGCKTWSASGCILRIKPTVYAGECM